MYSFYLKKILIGILPSLDATCLKDLSTIARNHGLSFSFSLAPTSPSSEFVKSKSSKESFQNQKGFTNGSKTKESVNSHTVFSRVSKERFPEWNFCFRFLFFWRALTGNRRKSLTKLRQTPGCWSAYCCLKQRPRDGEECRRLPGNLTVISNTCHVRKPRSHALNPIHEGISVLDEQKPNQIKHKVLHPGF